MYRKIEDFKTNWGYESQGSMLVFANLTDDSLSQKVSDDGRTLGFIAWHLTQTMSEMLGLAGLKIDSTADKDEMPDNVAEIMKIYDRDAKAVTRIVEETWRDEELDDEIEMYGQKMKKGFILNVLITHQTHHRGQMTVLMRQAGLKVPGIYGPAKEEWEQLGLAAMA